jgi:hypothetical protein
MVRSCEGGAVVWAVGLCVRVMGHCGGCSPPSGVCCLGVPLIAAQHYGDMHYPISFGGELHYPVGFLWKSESDMLGEQKPKEPCASQTCCRWPCSTRVSLMPFAAGFPLAQDAGELRGLGRGDG